MRFIGYVVDGKKYGSGQRKQAEAHAKKTGKKVARKSVRKTTGRKTATKRTKK